MIRSILVPIDGQAPSMHALDVAIEFAETMSATLTVMTVINDLSPWVGAPPSAEGSSAMRDSRTRYELEREELVEHALSLVPESVAVRKVLTYGHPSTKILEQLADGGYDLMVIGSRGLHGMGAALIGSVSRHVLERTKVPVLVVRAEDGREDWRSLSGARDGPAH